MTKMLEIPKFKIKLKIYRLGFRLRKAGEPLLNFVSMEQCHFNLDFDKQLVAIATHLGTCMNYFQCCQQLL